MSVTNREALAEADNALIESEDAQDLFKKLKWVYEVANKGLPVRLVGHPSVLNPLLELMLEDFTAGERVLELVERKRDEGNLSPLAEGFDRKAYMRELMSKKRDRQRRLMELTNELRSENDKIRGTARLEFERQHAERWHQYRLERENERREALGRRLTEEERCAIIERVWEQVDIELDDFELFVQREIRKPLRDRAPQGYQFKIKPKESNGK